MFTNIFQNQKKEENIIILILRELGINVVELLTREQLYRQKKLPREISDIIESHLVENARFVNALKRNIFTEKELSEELREKILELMKWEKILHLAQQKLEKETHYKEYICIEEKEIKLRICSHIPKELELLKIETHINLDTFLTRFYVFNIIKTIKLATERKEKLSNELTSELETKERAENIQKLEKEELEAVRKELIELSQTLTTREKTINNEISENVVLRAQKAENSKKINQLETEKND